MFRALQVAFHLSPLPDYTIVVCQDADGRSCVKIAWTGEASFPETRMHIQVLEQESQLYRRKDDEGSWWCSTFLTFGVSVSNVATRLTSLVEPHGGYMEQLHKMPRPRRNT